MEGWHDGTHPQDSHSVTYGKDNFNFHPNKKSHRTLHTGNQRCGRVFSSLNAIRSRHPVVALASDKAKLLGMSKNRDVYLTPLKMAFMIGIPELNLFSHTACEPLCSSRQSVLCSGMTYRRTTLPTPRCITAVVHGPSI